MDKCATLDKVTYGGIILKSSTQNLNKPTWHQKEKLMGEALDLALKMDVSYPWTGTWGLLVVIHRAVKYLTGTGLVYITPVKPPRKKCIPYRQELERITSPRANQSEQSPQKGLRSFQGFCERCMLQLLRGAESNILNIAVPPRLQI
jgi:hypothetical protein